MPLLSRHHCHITGLVALPQGAALVQQLLPRDQGIQLLSWPLIRVCSQVSVPYAVRVNVTVTSDVSVPEPSSHKLEEGNQPTVRSAGLRSSQLLPHAVAQQVMRLQKAACTTGLLALILYVCRALILSDKAPAAWLVLKGAACSTGQHMRLYDVSGSMEVCHDYQLRVALL